MKVERIPIDMDKPFCTIELTRWEAANLALLLKINHTCGDLQRLLVEVLEDS